MFEFFERKNKDKDKHLDGTPWRMAPRSVCDIPKEDLDRIRPIPPGTD